MRALLGITLTVTIFVILSSVMADSPPPTTAATTRPVQAKSLSNEFRKAALWLAKHQHENGGWSQGEESREMGNSMDSLRDKPNVADTCMAVLALLRADSTPAEGKYAGNIRKGIEFVCGEVEKSSQEGLWVTETRGTRVQGKLGQYIDTFSSALLLAEVRNAMPDEASRKRVIAALDKVMDKIEKNQQKDGTWAKDGWAPALAQATAAKAINRAAQNGQKVDEKVRENAENYARGQFSAPSSSSEKGAFRADGSAGVALYGAGGSISGMQESAKTNAGKEAELRAVVASPSTAPAAKAAAQQQLDRFAQNSRDLAAAQDAVVEKLDDKQFVAGFGSNGGEEFLSYINIGESLVAKGGEAWEKWDKSMTENLSRIQNTDGSWSGHHCITGRTFCTSAAMMVLTLDRTQGSVAEKIRRQ